MRMALAASSAIHSNDRSTPPLHWYNVLRLATIEGARALGIGDITGSLVVGKQFDAMVVSTNCSGGDSGGGSSASIATSPLGDVVGKNTPPLSVLERAVLLADDRNVSHVFVAGALVVAHGVPQYPPPPLPPPP